MVPPYFDDDMPIPPYEQKTKGVLLSAWGRRGYIYAAYNLAFSIKHFNRRLPVYLYCDETLLKELSEEQADIFDEIIPIDIALLMQHAQAPANIKISAYEHLPFDYTLLLDVDALALQDLEPCIDEMIALGGPFYSHILDTHTIDKGDHIEHMYWSTANKIWEKYGLTKDSVLPCTNSSLQFIKKCDQTTRLLERVKTNLNDPIPLHELRNQWGGTQPDELYLNISLAQEGIVGKAPKDYLFMGNALSPLPYHKIEEQYAILSIFGGRNFTKPRYTEWYDKLLIKMFREHGKGVFFKYSYIQRDKHANNRPVKFSPIGRRTLEKANEMNTLFHSGKSGERIFLMSGWFKAVNEARQKEIDECLQRNLDNEEIERVFVMSEHTCHIEHPKLTICLIENRPTYNDFFEVMNAYADGNVISILCNGDIYIDAENARKLRGINFSNRALALSRWEVDINSRPKHFAYEWSQDTWIFRGKLKDIDCNSILGIMQCDNRVAYEINKAGYQVVNPSRDIKTYHLHQSGERTYDVNARQGGEGMAVKPVFAKDILKKRLLLIQPGKVGDILICAPMAQYFSEEYFVDWQCPEKYHPLFDSLPFANPVSTSKERVYDRIVDLSFGLGGKPESWWQSNKTRFNSFVEAKYELAGIPVQIKNDLQWKRNTVRENRLYEIIKEANKFDYLLCHESSDYGGAISVDAKHKVLFQPILDFTIFDWYKVIMNATEIHCIDSSLANFVDVLPDVKAKLFYYKTNKVPAQYDETLLTKNWTRINTLEKATV